MEHTTQSHFAIASPNTQHPSAAATPITQISSTTDVSSSEVQTELTPEPVPQSDASAPCVHKAVAPYSRRTSSQHRSPSTRAAYTPLPECNSVRENQRRVVRDPGGESSREYGKKVLMRRQWPTCSANGGLIEAGGSCWGVCYSSCAAAQPSVHTHSSYSHAEKLSRGFVAESMHTVVGKLDLKTSLTHKTAEEWKRQDHLRVKSEKRTGLRKDPVAEAVARVERGYPRTIPGFF